MEKKEQKRRDRIQQKQLEKERKRQKLLVVAKLKVLAKQRRAEGQRLLRVLLAGAAEAKYQVIIKVQLYCVQYPKYVWQRKHWLIV